MLFQFRFQSASNHMDGLWTINDLIPEFSDIALPLAGLVAMFVIVRNVNARKKRKKSGPL